MRLVESSSRSSLADASRSTGTRSACRFDGQRVAGEHDAHVRPPVDRNGQVRHAFPIRQADGRCDLRLVVAAAPDAREVLLDALVQRIALVRASVASPSCLSRSAAGTPGEPVTFSVPRTVRVPGSMVKISVVV